MTRKQTLRAWLMSAEWMSPLGLFVSGVFVGQSSRWYEAAAFGFAAFTCSFAIWLQQYDLLRLRSQGNEGTAEEP